MEGPRRRTADRLDAKIEEKTLAGHELMKYEARVTQVLKTGIHTIGEVRDGRVQSVADLPLPDRVEIKLDGGPDEPCIMYRYTDSGEFWGDTWHETLRDAFGQANYEYGLSGHDFHPVEQ